jgi:hypothetical protein
MEEYTERMMERQGTNLKKAKIAGQLIICYFSPLVNLHRIETF